ncbi:nucleotide pyrophosphohydrolase [Vibrio lentus]|uniref:MazG nucleotide pyrophosphohydrolase domain-containing protein n=1 Tax=Vibrio lentus TaxID=136468 RepID=UPI001E3F7BC8|nr:MazG nucleotide pyrophosphohydrolase domain-containing protein [Vibrio lentus]MCC4783753.1 nucleotide pyrophosphohydrolase [Vibrio lentus]
MDSIQQLIELAEKKIERDKKGTWSKGSTTYFRAMFDELEEVNTEMDSGRSCYLEDELGDILWVYLCLLKNLESDNKINAERVFRRAQQKYSERLSAINSGSSWSEVKERQKALLAQEHLINS